MSKEILCTLGPASLNDQVIGRLDDLGVTLFRINLCHTLLAELVPTIRFIQERTCVPICLDTEGAQIRTGAFVESSVALRENSIVRAHLNPVPGDTKDFNLYPAGIIAEFEVGDFISIDFNAALVQVIATSHDMVEMRVLNSGTIGRNKAVTVDRDIVLPSLTEKDRDSLRAVAGMGIEHFALSFASRAADVEAIRDIVGKNATIISKIENRDGLKNLEQIADASEALLIDRGDLSRQMPIEQIPRLQKSIIRRAKKHGVKVYVATNLLESMVTAPEPTRAEVNDIYNTLIDGADGLVMAAETAIGAYPVRCAGMVVKMIREFEQKPDDDLYYHSDPCSLLVDPHGGRLVHRQLAPDQLPDIDALPKVAVKDTDLMDCEQIAYGTYSPLSGFMDADVLDSVLNENTLPDGTVWTLPILLQVEPEIAERYIQGDRIALTDGSGAVYAVMDVTGGMTLDIETVAEKWFGTTSRDHPGVARLMAAGNRCLAGDIILIRELPSPWRHYQLTPAQTRFLFTHKGWSRVVGFHTRNAAHRVHEFIQLEALERTGADGLFISPVIGPKKSNDFLPSGVLNSYQMMLDFGLYPNGRVVLSGFATYSRYSGPREAVFTALCRKNMGCSHFIVGRDHTGVGDFYPLSGNHDLFERLGDIGITPVFFDAVGYNAETRCYQEAGNGAALQNISGTQVREALRDGKPMPDWFMRDMVQDMLRREIAAGREVFFT